MRTYAHTFSLTRLGRVPPQHLPNLIPKEHAIRLTDLFHVRFKLVFFKILYKKYKLRIFTKSSPTLSKNAALLCKVDCIKLILILVFLVPFKITYLMPKIERIRNPAKIIYKKGVLKLLTSNHVLSK